MYKLRSALIFSAVALACSVLAANNVNAQGWEDAAVTVFNQRNGGGQSQSFSTGEYRNNRGELRIIGNDRASSVYVSPGYRVRLCESEGNRGSGRCEEYGEGYHNLRYNNAVSYISVTGRGFGGGGNPGGRGVTVFDDRDFRGASQTFGAGRYLNNAGQLGAIRNDEASSVIVDRGFRVRFCENEGAGNGGGRCDEYNEGRFNIRLNDEASYIEVRRAGGWGGGWGGGNNGGNNPGGNNDLVIVYSDRNQSGDQQAFGVGTFRNDQRGLGNIGNDKATSIMVPRGYRVRICDSEGGGRGSGLCEEYGPGSRNLRYNDRMSYIRVTRSLF